MHSVSILLFTIVLLQATPVLSDKFHPGHRSSSNSSESLETVADNVNKPLNEENLGRRQTAMKAVAVTSKRKKNPSPVTATTSKSARKDAESTFPPFSTSGRVPEETISEPAKDAPATKAEGLAKERDESVPISEIPKMDSDNVSRPLNKLNLGGELKEMKGVQRVVNTSPPPDSTAASSWNNRFDVATTETPASKLTKEDAESRMTTTKTATPEEDESTRRPTHSKKKINRTSNNREPKAYKGLDSSDGNSTNPSGKEGAAQTERNLLLAILGVVSLVGAVQSSFVAFYTCKGVIFAPARAKEKELEDVPILATKAVAAVSPNMQTGLELD